VAICELKLTCLVDYRHSIWELLSPLNDHMADTTLPLLMQFASIRPGYLHKTVAQSFNDSDWEVRFGALDPVFGLFSKLDDALVKKLFFLQPVTNTAHVNTKGKGAERGHHHHLHYHLHHQKRSGTMSQEPECSSEREGAGLNGGGCGTSNRTQTHYGSTVTGGTFGDRGQQFLGLGQFQPHHLQILGPIFSHFVSSMWDKEDAVRAKAKTLLKSLQPVHVGHALKAWELHFVTSPPDVQQTLLKLMTRLNNYFPGWKIMEYGLIFRLLTSGELGQTIVQDSGASITSRRDGGVGGSIRSSIHGGGDGGDERVGSLKSCNTLDSERPKHGTLAPESDTKGLKSRRASLASMSDLEKSNGSSHHRFPGHIPTPHLPILDGPMLPGVNHAEQSRSQRRASIVSTALSSAASLSVAPIPALADMEAHEKQLELEDDIHCSLLNLALQMVANGIEPRLDEVIQLKYLVVFYLDFEGCELVGIGQGKFQVRYGEYIPRRRASPIHRGTNENSASSGSLNDVLNDPGHENFVLAICMNLQLILDRYVEIKPDYEEDPPTLYDQYKSRPTNPGPPSGSAGNGYDGGAGTPVDFSSQQPVSDRTFSSTTGTTTTDHGKESSRGGTMTTPQQDTDGNDAEHHHRHHGLFCWPRHKHHDDDHHHNHKHTGDARMAQSTVSQKNPHQTYPNAPIYQQHHHHHYRRKSHRRHDENTPVVGTYFVDVILRFFGSETDLATLPAGRLKNWLELLLIVIYKYVKEVDPLSDLVVVLMKRIVEMLMVKKSGPNVAAVVPASSLNGAGMGGGGVVNGSTVGSAMGPSPTAATAGVPPGGVIVPAPTPAVGEESMSEENILLAISICSTLLTRSSTMTTALLSREIMAMGKLMTKRRDDPDDPVLNRARSFLHDAFVHFMGNGLFVLVFKVHLNYVSTCVLML
jgi:hypothetical protein